jgi:hypothetical protein
MSAKFSYRPSRTLSAFAGLVALAMAGFGIYTFRAQASHPFVLLWVCVALGIAVFHLVNAFSKRGVSVGVIERVASRDDKTNGSTDARLVELEALRAKRLVSEQEYASKRREILADL